MQQDKIYEFVLFDVKQDKTAKYYSVYDYFYSKLNSFAGFNSIETYQSCNVENKHFDFAKWDSLEQAKSAADMMVKDPEFKKFFDLMEESVFFHHGELIERTFKEEHTSESDCQLTIYQVPAEKQEPFFEQREILYNILRDRMIGFQGIYTFKSITEDGWFIDLSYCKDIQAVMDKQKDLNDLPEMKNLMTSIGEVKFCGGIKRKK